MNKVKIDYNCGSSWGLEYPLIYGKDQDGQWKIWDRHTGEISMVCGFEREAMDASNPDPKQERFSPFEYDAIE